MAPSDLHIIASAVSGPTLSGSAFFDEAALHKSFSKTALRDVLFLSFQPNYLSKNSQSHTDPRM